MYVTGEMGKASLGCLGWRWPGRVSKISIGEGLRVHQSKVIEGGRRERGQGEAAGEGTVRSPRRMGERESWRSVARPGSAGGPFATNGSMSRDSPDGASWLEAGGE